MSLVKFATASIVRIVLFVLPAFLLSCGRPVPSDLLSGRGEPVAATDENALLADPGSFLPRGRDALPGEWHDVSFIGDWNMDAGVVRLLGAIWHRMGDAAEILGAAARIRPGSELSWYGSWTELADRVRELGAASLAAGHRISAGEAYLRASNYYRASEFYLHANPSDPRILEAYRNCRRTFLDAMELLEAPCAEVRIPYEGTTLRGYWFLSPSAPARGPVLIGVQGFDGAMEETKWFAEEAVLRGYHCLMLEGPGQGLVLREQGLTVIREWERPIGAAVDWLVGQAEVDPSRIGLMGMSMAGAYVLRAAEFEPRLAAVIANPGYLDLGEVLLGQISERFLNLYREDPEEFAERLEEFTGYGIAARWFVADGKWKFGADSIPELFETLLRFDYEADVARVRCRYLIMDGEDEIAGADQSRRLYELLDCPKTYMLFEQEDFSSWHCQNGATAQSAARMFDWIEENL